MLQDDARDSSRPAALLVDSSILDHVPNACHGRQGLAAGFAPDAKGCEPGFVAHASGFGCGTGIAGAALTGEGIKPLSSETAPMIGIAAGGTRIAPATPAPATAKCAMVNQTRFEKSLCMR